jgi:hypothetical protein
MFLPHLDVIAGSQQDGDINGVIISPLLILLCLTLTLVEPYENIDNLFSEIRRDVGVVRETVYHGVGSVGGISEFEGREPHRNTESFGFFGTGNDTAIVIGQHDDGFALQQGLKDAFTRDVKVVAID